MKHKLNDNRRHCDVLLIHPPWFRLQDSSLIPYPAGPCSVAAVLEAAGLDALVWNGDFAPEGPLSIGGTDILKTDELVLAHDKYLARLNDHDDPIWYEVLEIIEITSPKIVGISVYSASFKSAANIATIIKEKHPDIAIVFGGVHASIAPEDCLSVCSAVDVVMVGEAECSSAVLFSALLAGKKSPPDLAGIKGIAYRENGTVVRTEPAEAVENLDTIPFPARHLLIDLDKMPPHAHQALYGFRGCPFNCIFCGSFNVFGRKPRMRSAEKMVEEIEFVHQLYGTRYFYICDDIFLLYRKRALKFCSLLKKKKLNVYYSIQTRGEMMDEDLLAQLKATGCQHLAIGVEVGDEEIRKLIKKGNTVDDIRRAARMIRQAGLRMVGFFMFGFPWETKEQMLKTADLMEEINPCISFPYIVTPAPGTELLDIAQNMGLVDPHVDLSSFSHISPKMGISANVSESERKQLIDGILERFAQHNRKSLRYDFFRRPGFYLAAARDVGITASCSSLLKYLHTIVQ